MLRKTVCTKIRYLLKPVFSSPLTRYKPAEGNGEGERGAQLGSAHGSSCLGNDKLDYELTTPERSFVDI